jgi:hypothetical protein
LTIKIRIPFPIDCEKVSEVIKDESVKTYEDYLNTLGKNTYFILGNGPS